MRSLIPTRPLLGVLVAAGCLGAAAAQAQSVLERPPNLQDTWVGSWGTAHFHFMHRFRAGEAPERDVQNTPTFLLAAGLPGGVLAGARYATSSPWVRGFPNEWEFFGRYTPLSQPTGAPLDLSLTGAYNHAADSFDGQLVLARSVGPLRLIGAARGFTDAFRRAESRAALAGGATLRVTQSVALAADAARLVDAESTEKTAWSAGLQVLIPTTPHTLSLHASNAHTTTLQGSSIGGNTTLWGFEFTVPITMARYFGRRAAVAAPVQDLQRATTGGAVVIDIKDLAFEPRSVRIAVGDTVRWRNTSVLVHTVTGDPRSAADSGNVMLPDGAAPFDSGMIDPEGTFTYVFTVPGEYRYVCIPHELAGMLGTILVSAPAGGTGP